MPAAIQMPVRREKASSVGPRTFRKQVLKVGSVQYKGRTLDFTRDYLRRLADHFKRGAFDQVPFLLVNEKNEHVEDPEKFRGEVKGFELSSDGLDAIIEMNDDGARLVRNNPRLGVSARIIEAALGGGGSPKFSPAIKHVAATLDPHVTGMRNWEAVSDLGNSYSAGQVIDLTAAKYDGEHTEVPETKLTDDQKAKLKEELGDESFAKVSKILGGEGGAEGKDADRAPDNEPKEKDEPQNRRGLLARILGRKSDDQLSPEDQRDFDQALDDLLKEEPAAEKDDADKKDEPVVANLSKDAQAAIDLAKSEAKDARDEVAELRRERVQERFEAEKARLVGKGVPPAAVDLAKPLLTGARTIDLANGEKADPADIARKLLDEFEGTVDLSAPAGSAKAEDDPERAEASEMADAWEKADRGEVTTSG